MSSVVLPDPEGPSSVRNSPSARSSVASASAVTAPEVLVAPRIESLVFVIPPPPAGEGRVGELTACRSAAAQGRPPPSSLPPQAGGESARTWAIQGYASSQALKRSRAFSLFLPHHSLFDWVIFLK